MKFQCLLEMLDFFCWDLNTFNDCIWNVYREDILSHNARLCFLIIYCKYLDTLWPWWSCLLFCLLEPSPSHSPVFVAPSGRHGEREEVGLAEYGHAFTWHKVIFLSTYLDCTPGLFISPWHPLSSLSRPCTLCHLLLRPSWPRMLNYIFNF